MLDIGQRIDRYYVQNDRNELTPRQARRVIKKARHQSPEAREQRLRASISRADVRALRADNRAMFRLGL